MSDLDTKAISAAIAGFLACHVLTCRFLVKEGVIDRDRFIAYLEAAREDMRPGIEDPRSLFPLTQLIDGVRGATADIMLQ